MAPSPEREVCKAREKCDDLGEKHRNAQRILLARLKQRAGVK